MYRPGCVRRIVAGAHHRAAGKTSAHKRDAHHTEVSTYKVFIIRIGRTRTVRKIFCDPLSARRSSVFALEPPVLVRVTGSVCATHGVQNCIPDNTFPYGFCFAGLTRWTILLANFELFVSVSQLLQQQSRFFRKPSCTAVSRNSCSGRPQGADVFRRLLLST